MVGGVGGGVAMAKSESWAVGVAGTTAEAETRLLIPKITQKIGTRPPATGNGYLLDLERDGVTLTSVTVRLRARTALADPMGALSFKTSPLKGGTFSLLD